MIILLIEIGMAKKEEHMERIEVDGNSVLAEEIKGIMVDAEINVGTTQDLFLRLSSLNYLNSLVKKKEYKGLVNYGMIKPNVIRLVIDLFKQGKERLSEEIGVNLIEDCLYIRIYGVQFSFHHVNTKMLTDELEALSKNDVMWAGVKLQPAARDLYEFSHEVCTLNLDEITIKKRITNILEKYAEL